MKSVVVSKFIAMFILISYQSKSTEGSSSTSDANDCYTFHDVDSTWTQARDACREMGAHLVTMETTGEWNKVKGLIAKKVKKAGSYHYWYIGLREEQGTWKWTEAGSPGVTLATDDSRWQSGEPSVSPPVKESCGEISSKTENQYGHFNNVGCNREYATKRGYICENY